MVRDLLFSSFHHYPFEDDAIWSRESRYYAHLLTCILIRDQGQLSEPDEEREQKKKKQEVDRGGQVS